MHSTGTIFLDRKWLATNMEKFAKDYDALAKKPEDKGTHLMIKLDLQDASQFAITNETLSLSLASVDEKDKNKTLAYLTLNYDLNLPIQEKIASWHVNRGAQALALLRLLMSQDQQEE